MPSSPFVVLLYTLLSVGLACLVVWAIAKDMISDAPFLLDAPEAPGDKRLNARQRLNYLLRLILYAFLWLTIISIVFGAVLAYFAASAEMPDWAAVVALAIVIAAWIAVLYKRVSLRWPLTGAGLCFVGFGGLAVSVITATGLGKLMIMSFGRASAFTPSRLRAEKRRIRPRGLVEGFEND